MRKFKRLNLTLFLTTLLFNVGIAQLNKSTITQDVSLEIAGNYQYAIVKYIKDNGKDGEDLTAHTVNVRDLNILRKTYKSGEEDWIELDKAINRIKLKPGIYKVNAKASSYAMSYSKLVLYDVTGGKSVVNGLNHYDAGYATVLSLNGIFEIAVESDLELQQYTNGTRTNGGGLDVGSIITNLNGEELYTEIEIIRLTKP